MFTLLADYDTIDLVRALGTAGVVAKVVAIVAVLLAVSIGLMRWFALRRRRSDAHRVETFEQPSRQRIRWQIWLLVAYVLSYGPGAVLLFILGGSPVAVLVYFPLLILGHYFRPFMAILDWYQNLWWEHTLMWVLAPLCALVWLMRFSRSRLRRQNGRE